LPSGDKETVVVDAGHIGMSVSSASHRLLWPKVATWLKERSDIVDNEEKARKKKSSK
jgi:polyhydroxyalkanoate synthase